MPTFDYVAAETAAEVTAYLTQERQPVRILAGGTDLLVQLREGRRQAALVVDIKRLPEVNELTYDPAQGLRLGAAVPCWRVCADARIAQAYPGLIDAAALIGGTQIQGRATLGGNLCNASPAADTIPALIVHRAQCVICGPRGERELPVEEFCTAPGRTALAPGEFLVMLRLPPPPAVFGAAYLRFTPRNEMDIAVAGAGAALALDEGRSTIVAARVALASVAPTPLFVPAAGESLVGRPVGPEAIRAAANLAGEAARPIDDLRGDADQRVQLAMVLTRRALERALERAK